jgi:2-polyprenyl-3-methyl-5-hydroxy-6-metoxy-1,4-benzoquinol methylase
MTNRETLLHEAAGLGWFHAIDFGDCQSPGRFAPGTPQNRTLFGVMDMLNQIDLTGLDCLDIGTADGLIAFNMAARGAARVVATDRPANGRPTYRVARELLDLNVEMSGGTTFDNIIDKLGEHAFDVVVCSGVMYHMLNPFDCILKARRLLKRNGILLFQTRYHPEDTEATLDFNPVSGRLNQLNVFWVPSKTAVTGMLALRGFKLLAVRTGTKNKFISTIARNVDTEEITDAPELILSQHERGISYPEFRQDPPRESSTAVYRGSQDDIVIDDLAYEPDFPPHPTKPKPIIGETYDRPNRPDVSTPVEQPASMSWAKRVRRVFNVDKQT